MSRQTVPSVGDVLFWQEKAEGRWLASQVDIIDGWFGDAVPDAGASEGEDDSNELCWSVYAADLVIQASGLARDYQEARRAIVQAIRSLPQRGYRAPTYEASWKYLAEG